MLQEILSATCMPCIRRWSWVPGANVQRWTNRNICSSPWFRILSTTDLMNPIQSVQANESLHFAGLCWPTSALSFTSFLRMSFLVFHPQIPRQWGRNFLLLLSRRCCLHATYPLNVCHHGQGTCFGHGPLLHMIQIDPTLAADRWTADSCVRPFLVSSYDTVNPKP
jgi:hypothetical protein